MTTDPQTTEPVCKFDEGCHRVVPCDPGCAVTTAELYRRMAAPAARPELRDQIADALMAWAERNNNPKYAAARRSETVVANAYSRADAVLAVLLGPIPADTNVATWTAVRAIQLMNEAGRQRDATVSATTNRAAVLREEATRIRAHCPDHLDSESAEGAWITCHCDVADDMERRMAVEAQPQTEGPTSVAALAEGANETGTSVAAESDRRYRYAAAIRGWWDADDGGDEEIAAAVMDVANGESAALRIEVARLNRRIRELDQPAVVAAVAGEAPALRCVCGDPVEWMDVDVAYGSGWIHGPGSDTPCLNARPRCPHCHTPHDLNPDSGAPAACASILASIRDRDEERAEVVHGCPPDGSGLTPCCGCTPFELPLGDRISSEAPITCTGRAAVSQPGKEN